MSWGLIICVTLSQVQRARHGKQSLKQFPICPIPGIYCPCILSVCAQSRRKLPCVVGSPVYIQCNWKVFRPLDFFHIFSRYSLILKCIKLFFSPSSIYTQSPPMTQLKQVFRNVCKFIIKITEISYLHKCSDPFLITLLKHLWQRLQPWVFLGMMLQAWHTCIWGVSPIILYRSSQALSGWMGSIAAQLFSDLSSDVRSGSSPGSG